MCRDGQFKGVKGITAGQVVTVILRDEKGVSLVHARPFGLEKIIQRLVTDCHLREAGVAFLVQAVRAFVEPKPAKLFDKPGNLATGTGSRLEFNPCMSKVVGGPQVQIAAPGIQDQAPKIIDLDIKVQLILNGNCTFKVAPIRLRCNVKVPEIELISRAQAGKIGEQIGRVNLLRRDDPGVGIAHVEVVSVQIKRRAHLARLEVPVAGGPPGQIGHSTPDFPAAEAWARNWVVKESVSVRSTSVCRASSECWPKLRESS